MSRNQGKELSMRKVREILRLGLVCQLSQRRIAQSCHMSQASVSKFLNLAKQREIEGAQVSQFSDEELMKALGLNSNVHSILKKGLDRHPLSKPEPTPQLEHENIRGAHYYQ